MIKAYIIYITFLRFNKIPSVRVGNDREENQKITLQDQKCTQMVRISIRNKIDNVFTNDGTAINETVKSVELLH